MPIEDEYAHHNGDFKTYFQNKQLKLQNQASDVTLKSSIFKDVKVFINGYTTPPPVNLKKMIIENGGSICSFLQNKSSATHIVASNITNQKTITFKDYKIVKPEWITESISQQKLLNWTNYRTRVNVASNESFQPLKIDHVSDSDEESHHATSADENIDDFSTEESQINWILEQRKRHNCLDPDFLTKYFEQSRLHFMSTRKLELRKRCTQFQQQNTTSNDMSDGKINRTLMHVDFDAFFVSVGLKSHPQLLDHPVCISFGSASSDVASCNYIARNFGVKNGMSVAHAKSLCPQLKCLPYEFTEYERCSDVLYKVLMDLNPCKIAAISADECMIDVTNLDTTPDQLGTQVRNQIRSLTGIEVSVGFGSNLLLAKLALKRAKPAGICELNATEIDDFEVRDLPGVGFHIMNKLQSLKVTKLKDLKTVQINKLNQLIGLAMARKLYGYARGEDTSDLNALVTPVRTVGIEIGWGVRLVKNEEKPLFLERCSLELWKRLKAAGLTANVLTLKVYKRAKNAHFIPSKPLGHGKCDILTKSKRVSENLDCNLLKQDTQVLLEQIECSALEFRGVGLHMSVHDNTNEGSGKRQITFNESVRLMQAKPVTPEKSRPLIAIPPRKLKRKYTTLTQIVNDDDTAGDRNSERRPTVVDLNVFKELPTQIRREIMLNEDDYTIPQRTIIKETPVYKTTELFGKTSFTEKQNLITEWVKNGVLLKQDVKYVYDFVKESLNSDSAWIETVQLVEWIGVLAKDRTEEWRRVYFLLLSLVNNSITYF